MAVYFYILIDRAKRWPPYANPTVAFEMSLIQEILLSLVTPHHIVGPGARPYDSRILTLGSYRMSLTLRASDRRSNSERIKPRVVFCHL